MRLLRLFTLISGAAFGVVILRTLRPTKPKALHNHSSNFEKALIRELKDRGASELQCNKLLASARAVAACLNTSMYVAYQVVEEVSHDDIGIELTCYCRDPKLPAWTIRRFSAVEYWCFGTITVYTTTAQLTLESPGVHCSEHPRLAHPDFSWGDHTPPLDAEYTTNRPLDSIADDMLNHQTAWLRALSESYISSPMGN